MVGNLCAQLKAMLRRFLMSLLKIFLRITNMVNQSGAGDNKLASNQDITSRGISKFAIAEQSIYDAIQAIGDLPDLIDEGYQNGAVNGKEAIEFRCGVEKIRGELGVALRNVLDLHVIATDMADNVDVDIDQPYTTLPTRNARSGGGR